MPSPGSSWTGSGTNRDEQYATINRIGRSNATVVTMNQGESRKAHCRTKTTTRNQPLAKPRTRRKEAWVPMESGPSLFSAVRISV